MEIKTARHPIYDWLVCYEDGRIWSEKRNKWLKGTLLKNNHFTTSITVNMKQIAHPYLHTLIYEAFNGIYDHKKFSVHHINKNGTDNRLENLILYTRSEHRKLHSNTEEHKKSASKTIKKAFETRIKIVFQYSKDGRLIRKWESATEAERQTGINHRCISACCLGKCKSSGGFVWKFY